VHIIGLHGINVALRPSKRWIAAIVLASCCAPACLASQPVKGTRWTWPRGARVAVRISNDLDAASTAAVVSAFRRWERAGDERGNGSGVAFVLGDADTPFVFHLGYGRVVDGGQAHTLMLSAPGGVFVAWTVVDRHVTDPVALSHVMAHEIGHTFGLAECDACEPGSSVMTRFNGDYDDVVSGRNAPSGTGFGTLHRPKVSQSYQMTSRLRTNVEPSHETT